MPFFIEFSIANGGSDRRMLVAKPLVVGRSDSCDVIVDDPYVSGRHLEFWEDRGEKAFVRDMHSSNGTSRNGEEFNPGERILLADGDRIDLADGRAVILVSEDDPSPRSKNAVYLPEGTVTFMFTDIVGSTGLVSDFGDIRSRDLFRTHEEILRDTITRNQGFIVKEQGDGFMAAFPSIRSAIISAIAIQKSLFDLRREQEDLNIYIRIGINTGEAIVENNDYFGRAVNEAARISAQASSEEILVSSVSKRMADSAGDIAFGDAREIDLKGLPGSHIVYPALWRT